MVRPSSTLIPLLFILVLQTLPARATVSYQFCVTRTSDVKVEKFGARYNFGAADPGKEVARVLVSQKYKQADTTGVRVGDYNQRECGAIREETNVTATSEQLQQLGAAVGRGDPVGTAIIAAEIYTGVQVKQVKAVSSGVGRAARWVRRRF